jgi:membrane protein YqaA with SNARE-associated domain
LSYVVIAFALAILFFYGFRRRFAGNFWGAVSVAIIGAFLGGLVDYLFSDIIQELRSINGILNIFPPIIAATLVLSVFATLSERKDTYD